MSSYLFFNGISLQKHGQLEETRLENLTTAEITSLESTLGVEHEGLIVYNKTKKALLIWDGTRFIEWFTKDGGSFDDSISFPKVKGKGIFIEDEGSWVDIIGAINPKTLGTTAAVLLPFKGEVKSWGHYAGSTGHLVYHIPHNYIVGSKVYLHTHWSHNGMNIQGKLKINYEISYGRRTIPNSPFAANITTSFLLEDLNITDYPQYSHHLEDLLIAESSGSGTKLDADIIEPDGLIIVNYEIDTIPSIDGSEVENIPYIHTFDLHIQTNIIGTINKDPDFWREE